MRDGGGTEEGQRMRDEGQRMRDEGGTREGQRRRDFLWGQFVGRTLHRGWKTVAR